MSTKENVKSCQNCGNMECKESPVQMCKHGGEYWIPEVDIESSEKAMLETVMDQFKDKNLGTKGKIIVSSNEPPTISFIRTAEDCKSNYNKTIDYIFETKIKRIERLESKLSVAGRFTKWWYAYRWLREMEKLDWFLKLVKREVW